ncbi:DUF6668 family protein [Microbacterium sp. W4I20]|uniref:DUF6668 family protein n=1 Tax=Microbacterium sp. W4I20 TaxID=3042262 RepID=UPI00277D5662|nr:DUF6668 family protein [Microbacterium sp. W4I20]MDQ0729104.1 hypothetical protein [Microbacterium sp. W4I20]
MTDTPTTRVNPFHRVRTGELTDTDVDQLRGEEFEGPASPEHAPPVVRTGDPDHPVERVTPGALVYVLGLHGGAGVSTVAGLIREQASDLPGEAARELRIAWPRSSLPGMPINVVAVARTHHRGLQAAERFARAWAAGTLPGGRLLGIVLVDDGPQLAKAQLKSIERIGRMTPHGWRIPWAEGWRLAESSLKGSSPRVRWAISRIRKLAQTPFTEGKK